MALHLDGTDVRIHDGRIWVLIPAGAGARSAHWKRIALEDIRFDADWPEDLISPYARHPLADLGIDALRLSHLLGLPRRDGRRFAQLWRDPRALQGSALAVDFERKELAPAEHLAPEPLVYPFSAIAAITLAPPIRLIEKTPRPQTPGTLLLGQLLLTPQTLARHLAVPVLPENNAEGNA